MENIYNDLVRAREQLRKMGTSIPRGREYEDARHVYDRLVRDAIPGVAAVLQASIEGGILILSIQNEDDTKYIGFVPKFLNIRYTSIIICSERVEYQSKKPLDIYSMPGYKTNPSEDAFRRAHTDIVALASERTQVIIDRLKQFAEDLPGDQASRLKTILGDFELKP